MLSQVPKHFKDRPIFEPDPQRPYLARGRLIRPDGSFFLKLYNLSAWSPTASWRCRVMERCRLIEMITSGRTRFRLEGNFLIRVSLADPGLQRLNQDNLLSLRAFENLTRLVSAAHAVGLPHGDITARNVAACANEADLFDWEPILVGPSHIPATEPVPVSVCDPFRWLGGCDLLHKAPPHTPVFALDQLGLRLLAMRYSQKTCA